MLKSFPINNKDYIYQIFILSFICFLLSLPFAGKVDAIELRDMEVVSLVVNSESEANRSRGVKKGLTLVLQRLTGNIESINTPAGRELIEQAPRYLIQFSYDTITIPKGMNLSDGFYPNNASYYENYPSSNSSKKILKLKFDQQLLIEKIQEAQLPVWGLNRPKILFWWVSQNNDKRIIFAESDRNIHHMALHYFAEKRALPIKLPLMDLRDRSLVSSSDLWGGYVDKISQANQRYQANSWVQGKSYILQGRWHAQWEVNVLGGLHQFKNSASTEFLLQEQVINTLADVLADEYAVMPQGNNKEIVIGIKQVGQLEELLSIKQYLERLFVVSHVEIKKITGQKVYLRLVLKEDENKFEKLLAADNKLVKEFTTPINLNEPEQAENITDQFSGVNYYLWLAK